MTKIESTQEALRIIERDKKGFILSRGNLTKTTIEAQAYDKTIEDWDTVIQALKERQKRLELIFFYSVEKYVPCADLITVLKQCEETD